MRNLDTMEQLDLGMSNLDGTVDEGLAEALQVKPATVNAQHSAWNFCGYVWFEGGKFREQVWQYHSPIEEFEADTLEELMGKANDNYGYE